MSPLFSLSQRVKKLPPYIFSEIDQIKQKALAQGQDLISLGVGDPDLPTPSFIINRLTRSLQNPENQKYPAYQGKKEFRQAIATWYLQRFQVHLDPDQEILPLIGSKEGIAHLPLAFLNPGEVALIPDPGYPVYQAGTLFADATPVSFALLRENGFLPDFSELKQLVQKYPKTRLLFLNYPNNPTAASATLEFFEEVVAFAKAHDIMVCHDNAYSEIYFDGKAQPSFLQARGAKDVGCEFHSLSKTFNMTGFRVGFVVGHSKIIEGLGQLKTNIDSGIFNACQDAAIEALERSEPFCSELRQIYQKRRDVLLPILKDLGLECQTPEATFYLWAKLPHTQHGLVGAEGGGKSKDFVMKFIKDYGIICTPGIGFGMHGEGFVRFTLCADLSLLKQVAERLKSSVQ